MSNFEHLGGGHYTVRTQAGFKQALRHYHAPYGEEADVRGYPSSYPSLIHISTAYCGYHYTVVDSISINALLKSIARSEASDC